MFACHRHFGRMFMLFAASFLLTFFAGGTLYATIVGAQSFGDEMVNARISVFFQQSGQHNATITAGVAGQGVASDAGFFDFSVSGDTFLAKWELTNTTTFDSIDLVLIDLSSTTSPGDAANPGPHTPGVLFDDNSLPSTLNGFAGRKGAMQVNAGAPFIIMSGEIVPWGDPMNLGDEFVQEEIFYESFGPGLTSVWRDDTDIVGVDTGPEVPEPSSAVLLLIASCGLMRRMHRRKR